MNGRLDLVVFFLTHELVHMCWLWCLIVGEQINSKEWIHKKKQNLTKEVGVKEARKSKTKQKSTSTSINQLNYNEFDVILNFEVSMPIV